MSAAGRSISSAEWQSCHLHRDCLLTAGRASPEKEDTQEERTQREPVFRPLASGHSTHLLWSWRKSLYEGAFDFLRVHYGFG